MPLPLTTQALSSLDGNPPPGWVDVSVPIADGMISWPDDPPVCIHRTADLANGDPATVSQLTMGSHTGTHVDAFSHFLPNGLPLDQMDLAPYLGPALVLDCSNVDAISRAEIEQHPLWRSASQPPERVLFKTRNSNTVWYQEPFNRDFVHLLPEAAEYLIDSGVRLVGVDYLSIDSYHATSAPCHIRLMTAGVYILEGLVLCNIPSGPAELMCLPLNLSNGDGAPARVLIKPL